MASANSSLDSSFQRLREFRGVLLRLHKALLHSERAVYEQFYGRIPSSGEFFRLVIEHDWFSWLRPMSQFIVEIDDALSAKEPITLGQVEALLAKARTMLQPCETGSSLEKRYYRAIQRDPDIALMHAEATRLLASPDADSNNATGDSVQ
ncbi:hypothetical protein HJG54_06015 [Leptolyngbya sp. NK1-12]|uniref:Uncharacterized protein n=1 Tax=Leptolyngbya sp. NK1-12 TaxID=2547451 RepID=A0AA96WHK7_9CYAN|nr:hypothetical protein [Leptolyngbya sp. NK1-12]WNZ22461.1 hypothetical protein HJG54_06015 [Leptolyngbya sp. NK1-12]